MRSEEVKVRKVKDFKKTYPNQIFCNTGISRPEYTSIHKWMVKYYGNEKTCEHCDRKGTDSKKYDWALKKGCKYERRRNNFIRLCTKCHIKYDFTEEKRKNISLAKAGVKNIHRYIPITQYDRNMNIIAEYENIICAAKSINHVASAVINNLTGRSKSCGGFIWKYKNPKTI